MQELILSATIASPTKTPMVACIGYFDGFHLGHQGLFNRALSLARQNNRLSAIISFEPDPWTVLKPSAEIRHLTTLEDRKRLAEQMGFDVWVTIQFDQAVADMEPETFVKRLKLINIQTLVCGFDFTFGKKGSGTTNTLLGLADADFQVEIVEELDYQGEKISTTRIKQAIEEGQMELVSKLLGRIYALEGLVFRGKQIGRKIGYPTANLLVDPEYVLPKVGVYAGYVQLNGLYYTCMIGLGYNPTVKDDRVVSIEAHIFDFDQDIYDKKIQFLFKHYLRPELKFNGLEALTDQLKKDEEACREIFRNQTVFASL